MIKVNLLRDHTARVRKTFVKPKVSRTGLILLAIAVLTAAAMGAWTLYIRQQIQTSSERRASLRLEDARLQNLKKEIDQFEKLKQMRKSRIDVIERLKQSQKGPVLLLNNLIQSIPQDGYLWVTSLTQKADRIDIVGMTLQPERIPDFMSNLMTCGMFQTVDLEKIEIQPVQEDATKTKVEPSKFSLVCTTGKKSEAE
jgi:Tfp pilus assembly protein PilN